MAAPRPSLLFSLALASTGVLVACAFAARTPLCTTGPEWFAWVFWILGPISLLAAFWGVFAYGRQHGFSLLGAIASAVVVAVLWGGACLFVLLLILVSSACLS